MDRQPLTERLGDRILLNTYPVAANNLMPVNRPVVYFEDLNGGTFFTFNAGSGLSDEIECKYGNSLDSLTATDTDVSGNIPTGRNGGKGWSIVAGYVSGIPYIYMLREDPSGTGAEILHRWTATSSGLSGLVTETDARLAGNPFMNNLERYPCSISADISGLFAVRRSTANINQFGSYGTLPTDGRTGEFGLNTTYFPEFMGMFQLSDGFIGITAENGSSGGATDCFLEEATKTNIGDAWGTFSNVTPSGFTARYSANESHWGQVAITQFHSGEILYANVADGGVSSDGDYGAIQVAIRENTQAGAWSLVSTDLLNGTDVYGVFAGAVGSGNVILAYIKRSDGSKSNRIHYRTVSSSGSVSSEKTLAFLPSGSLFTRGSFGHSLNNSWASDADADSIPFSLIVETSAGSGIYDRYDGLIKI